MKKNSLRRSIFLIVLCSVIAAWLCISCIWPALRLAILSILRSFASYNNLDMYYSEAVKAIADFAAESDYQHWLVTCGETSMGKVVRLVITTAEVSIAIFCYYVLRISSKIVRKCWSQTLRKKYLKHNVCNR